MRKILVRRNNKYNYFEYKSEGGGSFQIFPDWVNSTDKIKQYFVEQKRDTPDIIFCNQEGQPAKLYNIKLDEKFAGHQFAMVDFEKKFLFEAEFFVPDAEKLNFLQDHSSMKQDQEAIKIENDSEKIKYYLNSVSDETKFLYQNFLAEKMTPDVLKELCENNARTYGLPAEIEIVE
jgi:hypothetical protein